MEGIVSALLSEFIAACFMWLDERMNQQQRVRAIDIMKRNLETENDWIVQSTTAESLAHFARANTEVKKWLAPRLEKMKHDNRPSVARKAHKLLGLL